MVRSQSRSAFTLIELLVSLGTISILLALFLPAVQSARETARAHRCVNNLHQIGVAMSSYHNDSNSFAPTFTQLKNPGYGGFYSIHTRHLPYMDQRSVFNAINFEIGTWPEDSYYYPLTNAQSALNLANQTVLNLSIGSFLCPSDGGPFESTGNSYRGNAGVGPHYGTSVEYPDSGNGIFPEFGPVRMSQVVDGLSHTVAFSERLRGSDSHKGRLVPERDVYRMRSVVFTADDVLTACRTAARLSNTQGSVLSGKHWFWTGRDNTLYNHAQSPNGLVPDCTYGRAIATTDMATARSWHHGGVNTLMGDGSVRFVSETISLPVWRAFGTRNGREVVD